MDSSYSITGIKILRQDVETYRGFSVRESATPCCDFLFGAINHALGGIYLGPLDLRECCGTEQPVMQQTSSGEIETARLVTLNISGGENHRKLAALVLNKPHSFGVVDLIDCAAAYQQFLELRPDDPLEGFVPRLMHRPH